MSSTIKGGWMLVSGNLDMMNAFMHWSYVNSWVQSIVCYLQGVGNIVTDPQIIDLDHALAVSLLHLALIS